MTKPEDAGGRWGLALGLGLHAFAVQLAVVFDSQLPIVPLLWALLLWLVVSIRAEAGDTRGLLTAALIFALMTPLRWLTARWETAVTLHWPEPIATSPIPGILANLAYHAMQLELALLGLGAALVALVLTFIVVRAEPWARARGSAFVMGLALLAGVLDAGLLAQRTLTRPTPAAFIASLPVLAKAAPLTQPTDHVAAGDLTIDRRLAAPDVSFGFQRGDSVDSRTFPDNRGFVVRHDVQSDLMFFDDGTGPRAISSAEQPLIVASDLELLPAVRPPTSWAISALLGVVLALGLLASRHNWQAAWGEATFTCVVAASALSGLVPVPWP